MDRLFDGRREVDVACNPAITFAIATLAAITSLPVFAASQGRPVPTDTIIIPRLNEDSAIPVDPSTRPGWRAGTRTRSIRVPENRTRPYCPWSNTTSTSCRCPVKRLREQIIEAASTGDPEKLRPIIDANGEPPEFSFNEIDDPIAYLKSLSGDPEGREILAILIEVLDAGYVHVDVGTPEEMYVWPYFARYPVDKLTPQPTRRTVQAGLCRRLRGHEGLWRLSVLPRRHRSRRHVEVLSRRGLTAVSQSGAAAMADRKRTPEVQAGASVSRKRTVSPVDGSVSSSSHMTRRPRTTVPTGQPVTVCPS